MEENLIFTLFTGFSPDTIISAMAGGIAGALVLFSGKVWAFIKALAGKTPTDLDDKFLAAIEKAVKTEIKKKLK